MTTPAVAPPAPLFTDPLDLEALSDAVNLLAQGRPTSAAMRLQRFWSQGGTTDEVEYLLYKIVVQMTAFAMNRLDVHIKSIQLSEMYTWFVDTHVRPKVPVSDLP